MDRPYIVYSLSKTRTAQKFNRNKLQHILGDIHLFFNHCTDCDINSPQSLELTVYHSHPLADPYPAEQLNAIIHTTTQLFGLGEKMLTDFRDSNGQPWESEHHTWVLPASKLQQAIDYIGKVPIPALKLGWVRLFIVYHFKLRDPITNNELPNQTNTSLFCIWFSQTKSIAPTIYFPFEEANEDFWSFLDSISNYLPFKLEEKYLSIAARNKKGEIKSFKKITR